MRMIVSGLNACTEKRCFTALFGRYVYGFNPWTHCDRCLKSRYATEINPAMIDRDYVLDDHLFYLCCVGQDISSKSHPENWRRQTNVHLAVRPRKGSVAAIGSVYGVSFVIEDAQAIPIVRRDVILAAGSDPIPDSHSNCKMFQFGYQMFDAGPISFKMNEPEQKGVMRHTLRDEWIAREGINHSTGVMTDPHLAKDRRS